MELTDDGAPPGPALDVAVEAGGPRALVRLTGELDLTNADRLQQALEALRGFVPLESVVFDVAALRFIDSSGLAVLLGLVRQGTSVLLRSPALIVRELLSVTGLDAVLRIEQ